MQAFTLDQTPRKNCATAVEHEFVRIIPKHFQIHSLKWGVAGQDFWTALSWTVLKGNEQRMVSYTKWLRFSDTR